MGRSPREMPSRNDYPKFAATTERPGSDLRHENQINSRTAWNPYVTDCLYPLLPVQC